MRKEFSGTEMAQPRSGVDPGLATLRGTCALGSNLNPSCCRSILFPPIADLMTLRPALQILAQTSRS